MAVDQIFVILHFFFEEVDGVGVDGGGCGSYVVVFTREYDRAWHAECAGTQFSSIFPVAPLKLIKIRRNGVGHMWIRGQNGLTRLRIFPSYYPRIAALCRSQQIQILNLLQILNQLRFDPNRLTFHVGSLQPFGDIGVSDDNFGVEGPVLLC